MFLFVIGNNFALFSLLKEQCEVMCCKLLCVQPLTFPKLSPPLLSSTENVCTSKMRDVF